MKDFPWIRMGTIFAMLVGSLYILSPTILSVAGLIDVEDLVSEKIKGGVAEASEGEVDLDVRFVVREGKAPELAKALDARLAAAGLLVARTSVNEEGHVVVTLETGTEPADVRKMALSKGKVALYELGAVAELPEELPVSLAGVAKLDSVKNAREKPVPAAASPLPITWTGELNAKSRDHVLTLSPAPETDPGLLAVAVDGDMVGIAMLRSPEADVPATPEAPPPAEIDVRLLVRNDRLDAVLTTQLPGRLEVEAVKEEVVEQKAENKESALPAWVVAVLPDTLMPLGLDLRGGIDLTIQVELDKALVSQANRDRLSMVERANKDGLEVTASKTDRALPMMYLASSKPLSDISEFIRTTGRGDYEYVETKAIVESTRMQLEDGSEAVEDKEVMYHVYSMTSLRQEEVRKQAIQQVLDTLRKRVNETGVRDPAIVKKGAGRISVQLPGLDNVKRATATIGTTAMLEFRLLDHGFGLKDLQRIMDAAREGMPPLQFEDARLVTDWLHRTGRLDDDRIVRFEYSEEMVDDKKVKKRSNTYVLFDRVEIDGNQISNANVSFNQQTQLPYVSMEFKPAGGSKFCDITSENVGKQFAIILDNEVKSAPRIREKICGGAARIDMGDALDATTEANSLAVVLRTGSLNAPVSIGEVRQVGPSLGRDAINSGSIATVIGGSIVLVFMGVWYRRAGLIANFALILNVLLMMAGLSLFGWTLTLPGIAGIALTIGMAVDANIIIYERIREELALGQQPRKAVDTGFDKGVVAVLDSNITTAIAGVVLYSYGNVTIQGFAVTLLIGIGTTLITALFVTRSLMEVVTRSSTARLSI